MLTQPELDKLLSELYSRPRDGVDRDEVWRKVFPPELLAYEMRTAAGSDEDFVWPDYVPQELRTKWQCFTELTLVSIDLSHYELDDYREELAKLVSADRLGEIALGSAISDEEAKELRNALAEDLDWEWRKFVYEFTVEGRAGETLTFIQVESQGEAVAEYGPYFRDEDWFASMDEPDYVFIDGGSIYSTMSPEWEGPSRLCARDIVELD